jgi:superfamily I DNA/RNA helicase
MPKSNNAIYCAINNRKSMCRTSRCLIYKVCRIRYMEELLTKNNIPYKKYYVKKNERVN